LFGEPDETVEFAIGDIKIYGVNPCQRCAVPSREPDTGDVIHGSQKTFSEKRKATLPAWAAASHFNHFYRLSINARISSSVAGKVIHVADALNIKRET
jgi:uncharacterized protein YcbX